MCLTSLSTLSRYAAHDWIARILSGGDGRIHRTPKPGSRALPHPSAPLSLRLQHVSRQLKTIPKHKYNLNYLNDYLNVSIFIHPSIHSFTTDNSSTTTITSISPFHLSVCALTAHKNQQESENLLQPPYPKRWLQNQSGSRLHAARRRRRRSAKQAGRGACGRGNRRLR